jgi:hypothetical protein
MNIQQLLSYKDYKEGLKALYSTFNLQLSREPIKDLLVDDNNKYLIDNYGWDLSQLWDLDRSIVVFLLPRLYVFYKTDFTLDEDLKDGKLSLIIEHILEALLLCISDNEITDQVTLKINSGLLLLGKYIRRLWN